MKISTIEIDGITVLKVVGRMTLEHIALLEQTVQKMLDQGRRGFVLNMVDVTDLSSSGIVKILNAIKAVGAKGGFFALSELSAVCEYVLDLAGLGEHVVHYKTDAEALAAVKGAM